MSPLELSEMIFEEIYDSQTWASWALFDNRGIQQLKNNIDELSQALAKGDKGILESIAEESISYYHNTDDDLATAQLAFPYVDAYDFFRLLTLNENITEEIKKDALEIINLIDILTIQSFYGRGYLPEENDFTEGKNGIYMIVPLGSKIYVPSGSSYWSHTNWYHPDDQSEDLRSYGQYDWCIDGAVRGNNQVDNFFELLDYVFDESNDKDGGVNGYQW